MKTTKKNADLTPFLVIGLGWRKLVVEATPEAVQAWTLLLEHGAVITDGWHSEAGYGWTPANMDEFEPYSIVTRAVLQKRLEAGERGKALDEEKARQEAAERALERALEHEGA